jgi:ligand-binding sensor domain-containing protein
MEININICPLLLLLFCLLTSCKAQVKTDPQKSVPKIVRTAGVSSGNISCELQDRDGNLWFSTSDDGIHCFTGKSFIHFTTSNGLCNNSTSSIIQDKLGNILIGTNSGICKYDGGIFSPYFEADTLNNLRITALLEDRDGNLWFSAMNKGIYRYDGTTISPFLYEYEHTFFKNKHEKMITDIIQDKKGNIWFSSFNRGGVWRYDGAFLTHFLPSSDYYTLHEDEKSNAYAASDMRYIHSPDYITDDMICSMREDKSGKIWFATRRHGICIYDGEAFTNFSDNELFITHSIITILEDKKGIFWLGTDEGGIFSYNGKTLKNYTTADGLVSNSVRSILEDKDGNLWFGTRGMGLIRYDGKSFVNFSE